MYEILSPKIFYFRGVFKDPKNFLEQLESSPAWEPWFAGGDDDLFTYGTLKTFHTELYKDIDDPKQRLSSENVINSIKEVNLSCGLEYLKAFDADESELDRFKTCVLTDKITLGVKKYYEGGIPLGPHPDVDLAATYDQISITFYPNDSYSGGELNFPEYGVKIKPEAGSAVIYPSKYIHESLPSTDGEKLVTNYVYIAKDKIWS